VPARTLDAQHWREVVRALTSAGHTVVVTGSPGERLLTAEVAPAGELRTRDLAGCTSLSELAEVIAGAEAVVVGNTGPAHLAAAVGTPVVSLFAPTVPARKWRPWMVPHVVLGDQQISCADCRARVCPVPGHPCVTSIRPAAVVDAVQQLMGAAPQVMAVAG
jgi:ADP-heptose:LPS heptosyltransferase